MPRGNRGILFALGLIALLAASSTVAWLLIDRAQRLETGYQEQANRTARDYANRAYVAAKSRCLHLPTGRKHQCIQEEYQTAREGQHDAYDLQAQLATSVWTKYMGIAAIIGMGAGIFGLVLVYLTFRATRSSVAETRRIGEAQTRAYLDLTDVHPGYAPVHIYFTVINSGSSPADDFEIWHGWHFYGPGQDVRSDGQTGELVPTLPLKAPRRIGANTTTAQLEGNEGADIRENVYALTPEQLAEGTTFMVWRFVYRYETVFRERRRGAKEYRMPFYWNAQEQPPSPHVTRGYFGVTYFAEWDEADEPNRQW